MPKTLVQLNAEEIAELIKREYGEDAVVHFKVGPRQQTDPRETLPAVPEFKGAEVLLKEPPKR